MTGFSVLDKETKRIAIWTSFFTVANIGVKGAYALVLLSAASFFSSNEYAKFSILYSLQVAISTFSLTGLQETVAARLGEYKAGSRRRLLFHHMSGVYVYTAVISSIMLTPLLIIALKDQPEVLAITAAVLLGALIGFGILQAGFQRIEGQNAASLFFSAGIPLAGVIGILIGLATGSDVAATFILALLGASLMTGLLIFFNSSCFVRLPSLNNVRIEFLILAPFLVISVFGWLGGYGMNFFIGSYFEAMDVAVFTFLFTLASVSQVIASSFNMIWAPRFYHLFHAKQFDQAAKDGRNFFLFLAIINGAVGCFAVAILPWITSYIGGHISQYGGYQTELAYLMSAYVLAIFYWHGQNYFHVSGYGQELMRLILYSGGAGIIVWIGCMIFLGPIGIFVGFLMQMALKSFSMWLVGRHFWGLDQPWLGVALGFLITFLGLLFPTPI